MGRRVATTIVVSPDGLGCLRGAPEPLIDQRRLANAGRPQEDDGLFWMEIRLQLLEPLAVARADIVNWYAGANLGNLLGRVCRVSRQVCLVEHNYGTCAATANQLNEALQAGQIEITVKPHDNEDTVGIRRQQLRELFTGCLPD